MEVNDLFENFKNKALEINPSVWINDYLKKIQTTFSPSKILDSIYQVEKIEELDRKQCHVLFFDDVMIHEIKYSRDTLEFSSLPRKGINSIRIRASNDQVFRNGAYTGTNKLELVINTNGTAINYCSDSQNFTDLLRIRNSLIVI